MLYVRGQLTGRITQDMSSPLDHSYSTSSALRLQPSDDLPLYDPQRNVRKSTLHSRVYHTQLCRAKPPVPCEPAEKRSGLEEQQTMSSQVLVPPEILSEIFGYFHEQDGFIALPINQRDFPWNVAGVCSQWRRVVWNIQGGFRTIIISAPQRYRDFSPAQVKAIRHALLHALSLSTKLVGIVINSHQLGIPIPYSHRIRELKLCSNNQATLSSLFQIPPGSFDHLEELELNLYEDGPGWIIFPNWSAQVMPALRALYVDSCQEYRDSPRPALSVPWTQLTELEVTDSLSTDNILHILRHSQRVISVKFSIIDSEVAGGPHLPFTLPHLAFLSISHEDPIDADHFLGPLTLPSLETIDIMDDEMVNSTEEKEWSHQPYTALINRSHCVIRQFSLESSPIVALTFLEDSIEPFLQALPAVENLHLEILVPSSTFMKIRQNRLLLELESVTLTLDTTGVAEFTDWLLSFEVGGDHVLEQATAYFHWHIGHRLVAVEKRFMARKAKILRAGIHARLDRCEICWRSHSEGDEGSGDSDAS